MGAPPPLQKLRGGVAVAAKVCFSRAQEKVRCILIWARFRLAADAAAFAPPYPPPPPALGDRRSLIAASLPGQEERERSRRRSRSRVTSVDAN